MNEKMVVLTPNYVNVLRRMAVGLANGDFEKGSERAVMATILDQARYLAKTDEAALFRIMHELDPSRPETIEEARHGIHNPDRG